MWEEHLVIPGGDHMGAGENPSAPDVNPCPGSSLHEVNHRIETPTGLGEPWVLLHTIRRRPPSAALVAVETTSSEVLLEKVSRCLVVLCMRGQGLSLLRDRLDS